MVRVAKFSDRLKFFADKVKEQKCGMLPFDYEQGEDWWPGMTM